jgi:hypothetical protein
MPLVNGHGRFHHLHQARFADACFAAEQHHLPKALLDLRSAFPQQRHLRLAAHQLCQFVLQGVHLVLDRRWGVPPSLRHKRKRPTWAHEQCEHTLRSRRIFGRYQCLA